MLRRRRLKSQFECRLYPAALTHPRIERASQCNTDAGGQLSAEIRWNRYSNVRVISGRNTIGRSALDFSRQRVDPRSARRARSGRFGAAISPSSRPHLRRQSTRRGEGAEGERVSLTGAAREMRLGQASAPYLRLGICGPRGLKWGNGFRHVSFAPLRGLILGMDSPASNAPLAFECLVRDHSGRIRQIARRFAANGAVDDLVQDILMRLWRSYAGFKGDSKVESWVYRVALNAAMTHLSDVAKARTLQAVGVRSTSGNGGSARQRESRRHPLRLPEPARRCRCIDIDDVHGRTHGGRNERGPRHQQQRDQRAHQPNETEIQRRLCGMKERGDPWNWMT